MSSTLFVKFLGFGIIVTGAYTSYATGMFGSEFSDALDLNDGLTSLAYIHMPDDDELEEPAVATENLEVETSVGAGEATEDEGVKLFEGEVSKVEVESGVTAEPVARVEETAKELVPARGDGVPKISEGPQLSDIVIVEGESSSLKLDGLSAIAKAFGEGSDFVKLVEDLKSAKDGSTGQKIVGHLNKLEHCASGRKLNLCSQTELTITKLANDMLTLLNGKVDGSNETYDKKYRLSISGLDPRGLFDRLKINPKS